MIVDKMKKRPPTAKNIKSKIDIPVGKWVKCDKCKEIVYKPNDCFYNHLWLRWNNL